MLRVLPVVNVHIHEHGIKHTIYSSLCRNASVQKPEADSFTSDRINEDRIRSAVLVRDAVQAIERVRLHETRERVEYEPSR